MDEWRLLGCPSPPSSICLPSLSSLSLVFIVRKCSGFQKRCISAQHSRAALQSPSRHDAALGTPHMNWLAGNTQANQAGLGWCSPRSCCRSLCDHSAMCDASSGTVWRQQKARQLQRDLGCPEQLLATIILTILSFF